MEMIFIWRFCEIIIVPNKGEIRIYYEGVMGHDKKASQFRTIKVYNVKEKKIKEIEEHNPYYSEKAYEKMMNNYSEEVHAIMMQNPFESNHEQNNSEEPKELRKELNNGIEINENRYEDYIFGDELEILYPEKNGWDELDDSEYWGREKHFDEIIDNKRVAKLRKIKWDDGKIISDTVIDDPSICYLYGDESLFDEILAEDTSNLDSKVRKNPPEGFVHNYQKNIYQTLIEEFCLIN